MADEKTPKIPPGGFLGDAEPPSAPPEGGATPAPPVPGELTIGEPGGDAGGGLDLGVAGGEVEALGSGEGELSSIFGGGGADASAAPAEVPAAGEGEVSAPVVTGGGGDEADGISGTFLGDSSLTEDIGDLGFTDDSSLAAGEGIAEQEAASEEKATGISRKINPLALGISIGIAVLAISIYLSHIFFAERVQIKIKGNIFETVEKKITDSVTGGITEGITAADTKDFTEKMQKLVDEPDVQIADFQLLKYTLEDMLKDGVLQKEDLTALRGQLAKVR